MADEATQEPTDLVDEFFAEGAEPEQSGGDDVGDFLKDVLSDEPEETTDKSDETTEETTEKSDDVEESEETESEESEEEETESEESEEEDVSEDPPKGSSKKASEDWKKLRGSRDKYKDQATELENAVKEKEAKLAEFEAKVAEMEGKAALSEELQAKLDNYDELERQVAMIRVEESPEYKKAVSEPLSTIEEQVVALGKENEASLDDIFDAVNEPDLAKQRIKLKEVTAGWDEIDKIELRNMAADARTLFSKQREMRENAASAAKQHEELTKAEAEKAAAAAKQEFLKASESVVSQIKEKMPFVPLREGETAEKRIAALAEKMKTVDYDSQSVHGKAVAAAAALALPTAIQTITKLQSDIKALEKRLSSKNASKPTQSAPVDDAGDDEEDFFESVGIKTLDASQRLKAGMI